MRHVSTVAIVLVLTALGPTLATAQDVDQKSTRPAPLAYAGAFEAAPPVPDGYGTGDLQILNLGWSSLQPIDSSASWAYVTNQFIQSTSSSYGWYCAGLDAVPNGALLATIGTYYYDDNVAENPTIELGYGYGPGNWGYVMNTSPEYSAGYSIQWYDLGAGHTVDQYANTYTMCFYFPPSATNGSVMFRNFRVLYRLQISPAPATATFNDVGTGHLFFRYVEALVDSGITAGCGGGSYCPDAPVTRGQMAVFLSKALGLHYPAF